MSNESDEALLETYDYALDNGLVDNPELSVNGLTIYLYTIQIKERQQ